MSKEKPILFSGPMVKAILEGRKTMTRRIVTDQNSMCNVKLENLDLSRAQVELPNDVFSPVTPYLKAPHKTEDTWHRVFPRIMPGDVIWVRETFADIRGMGFQNIVEGGEWKVAYKSDADAESLEIASQYGVKWKPSIHMPRWASRIDLDVTAVRPERIQDISPEDCHAEGIPLETEEFNGLDILDAFEKLWDSINGKKHPWNDNPWVWVIEFKVVVNAS